MNTTGPQPLSISHDSADNAYIVFEDNGGLSLLEMDSLGWSNRSLLGINGTNTGHINGAIDGQDRWQIVYTSQSGGTDLVFRYRDTNGTWSSEMDLASVSNSGVDAELQIGFDIDSNDNPSALFYEHQEQAPVLVDVDGFTNSQISSSTSQLVDLWVDLYNLGSTTGTYASLAIDSGDQHHMVFLNSPLHPDPSALVSIVRANTIACSTTLKAPSVKSSVSGTNRRAH